MDDDDDYSLLLQAFGHDPPSWVKEAIPHVFDSTSQATTCIDDTAHRRSRRMARCKNGDCCVFNPNYNKGFVFGDHQCFKCHHECDACVCGTLSYVTGDCEKIQKITPPWTFASAFKWSKLKKRGRKRGRNA